MSIWDGLSHRLYVVLHPHRYELELQREREAHLELEAMQQAARSSSSPTDARNAARRKFGNVTMAHEDRRDMTALRTLGVIAGDLRFALRVFRRTPGFTLVTILTLAIGIGANTAIFSALNALLLRPLPWVEPDRLMKLSITRPARGERPANDDAVWSWLKFKVLRRNQNVFQSTGLYSSIPEVTVRSADGAERIPSEMATGDYFQTLGESPLLGRVFSSEEDSVATGRRVVILSHRLFTRGYNADPEVIGSSMNIIGEPFIVIGVMKPGFNGMTGRADLWLPIPAIDPSSLTEAWSHSYFAIARLAPGISTAQAKAATLQLGAIVDRTYPDPEVNVDEAREGAIARELDSTRLDPLVQRSLLILLGAVALVLLIVCANVANLFLVRAAGRRHEMAVRMAIGATRWRLLRQLVTESVALTTSGGLLGVLLAWGSVRFLSALDVGRALNVRRLSGIGAVNFEGIKLDLSSMAVALGLSLITGLFFGTLPALHEMRDAPLDGLRHGRTRARNLGSHGFSSRNMLVAVEIALAVVLVSASGLLTRSLGNLLAVKPGFRTSNMLTLRFNTREGFSRDSMAGFYDAVAARLSGLPSVSAVAFQDCPPLNGGCNGTVIWRADRPQSPNSNNADAGVHWISNNWPTVMGVALRQGRPFNSGDRAGNTKVVLVSESAANRLWPNEGALGKAIGVGQGGFDSAYVVGVIKDVRYETLDKPAVADVYLPLAQSPRGRMMIMLRSTRDPTALVPEVRSVLRELAPDLPVYDMRTLESRVADSVSYARFSAFIIALFGSIALGLAALGVYGVISFSVSQRRREIGIRMALGASAGGVVQMVVGQGMRVAFVGATVGLALALMLGGLLRTLLYGVSTTDPLTFAGTLTLLMAAVAIASWIPARRASTVEPTEALREE